MRHSCAGGFTRRRFVRTAGALLGGCTAALAAGWAKAQGEAPTNPPAAASGRTGWRRSPNYGRTDGKETVARAVAMAGTAAGGPKVAVARCPRIWSDDTGVDPKVLAEVIDNAMMWFVGADSAEKAWRSLFSSDEKVGLKPNGLGGIELSTSQALSAYVVDRLTGIGVKRGNIIAWRSSRTTR